MTRQQKYRWLLNRGYLIGMFDYTFKIITEGYGRSTSSNKPYFTFGNPVNGCNLYWIVVLNHKVTTISNMASFFRFVDKRAIYRWYNLIRTCADECDWLFHWQHKLCATFSANVNINYRLPIKVYYHICTLRHIRIEINHGVRMCLEF
jgi:hypothetical protein